MGGKNMAKKSRRARKRSDKKRRIPASGPKQPVPVLAPGPTVAKETEVLAKEKEKAARLAEEYRYVYSDLKRIAILAATMLAALIVLSFVIR
jgi:hypothetical protein